MIIGVDEVGRGAWAGPMLFCAVSLKKPIDGLKDSKKLSKSQRQKLAEIIKINANFIGYGWVSSAEIDDFGLSEACKIACFRAIDGAPDNAEIIIDGGLNFLPTDIRASNLIKADDTVPEVSAASILAKVARDSLMTEESKKYPNFGFEKHVGYGTKDHLEAMKKNGLTPLHRWSFKPVKALIDNYEA
jgi:ribonuclease HII